MPSSYTVAGFVFDNAGKAVSSAEISIFKAGTTTNALSTTVTDASGFWKAASSSFSAVDGGFNVDVQITNAATGAVGRIKFGDRIMTEAVITRDIFLSPDANDSVDSNKGFFTQLLATSSQGANRTVTFPATTGTPFISPSSVDMLVGDGTGWVVGHTTQLAAGEVTSEVQILGTTETDGSIVVYVASETNTLSPKVKFVKNANAAIGTNSTSVADNEELGDFEWYGTDGTDADTLAAFFRVEVDDASPEAGGIGTAFVWANQPGGGTTAPVENMRLAADGTLLLTGNLQFTAANDIVVLADTNVAFEVTDGSNSLLSLDTRVTADEVRYMRINAPDKTFASVSGSDGSAVFISPYTTTLTGGTNPAEMEGLGMRIVTPTVTSASSTVIGVASTLFVEAVTFGGSASATASRIIDTTADAYLTAAGVWTDAPSTIDRKNEVADLGSEKIQELIEQIRPRSWVYKPEDNDMWGDRAGIIAEELPDFLRGIGDPNKSVVASSILAGFSLAAVRDLHNRIKELELEVERLVA